MNSLGIAFSFIAGASTLVGTIPFCFIKNVSPYLYCLGLAFSGGTIVYISLIEFFAQGLDKIYLALETSRPNAAGESYMYAVLSFLFGWICTVLLGWALHACVKRAESSLTKKRDPVIEDPPVGIIDEESRIGDTDTDVPESAMNQSDQSFVKTSGNNLSLFQTQPVAIGVFSIFEEAGKVAALTTLVLLLHNIPEGIITYMSTLADTKLGISTVVAISLHNIPEGFAVCLPVYYSTGKLWKGILWAGVAGFAEPFGAILAWAVVGDSVNEIVLGVTIAAIAGIMTCLAMQELIPNSLRYPEKAFQISIAFLSGMMVVGVSVVLLEFFL